MSKTNRFFEVTTGILIGMGWGLVAAVLEGLPLLLEGTPWPHLGPRLLALAFLTVLYGALGAAAGGLFGLLALGMLRLGRRTAPRTSLAAVFAGLFAAITTTVFWSHRFEPRLSGWLVVLVLAVPIGLAVRWLLSHVATSRRLRWPTYRAAVLVSYALALVAVVAVAGFRFWFRDLPVFNPPTTDQVATAERPNILLITAAGLRPDHLGANGHDPAVSPNIDALALRGVWFEEAVSQAAWTGPSLASLLTSLYPSQLNVACKAGISCRPHLDGERTTLAEALQGLGYRTQAYVTSLWLGAELGFEQGHDGFEGVRNVEPFDVWPMRARTLGRLFGCPSNSGACQLLVAGHRLLFDKPIAQDAGGHDVNRRVERFLDLHDDERFFLWVHYNEVLPPYDSQPPLEALADDPLGSRERRLRRMGYWQLGNPFTAREDLLPNDRVRLAALYDGEIHGLDAQVGRLLDLLDSKGLEPTTLVVLTSDHGQEFAEHGGYTYGHSLYDEVLRVPLIIAGPGIEAGTTFEKPVGLLDLSPTLAEVAGGSLPPEAEGRSLVPALLGGAWETEPIYSESLYRVPQTLKSLRQGDHQLIYNVDTGSHELYDLSAGPQEKHNLAAGSSQLADRLKAQLLEWMAHTARTADALPRAAPPTEYTPLAW
ncbi:sulfatase [Chloroflexota bacterium]